MGTPRMSRSRCGTAWPPREARSCWPRTTRSRRPARPAARRRRRPLSPGRSRDEDACAGSAGCASPPAGAPRRRRQHRRRDCLRRLPRRVRHPEPRRAHRARRSVGAGRLAGPGDPAGRRHRCPEGSCAGCPTCGRSSRSRSPTSGRCPRRVRTAPASDRSGVRRRHLPAVCPAGSRASCATCSGARSGSLLLPADCRQPRRRPRQPVTVRTPSGTTGPHRRRDRRHAGRGLLLPGRRPRPGAGVSAPPDNVVLVRPSVFRLRRRRHHRGHQLHVGFDPPALPSDPQAAALDVQGTANHFQAAVAGGALVGDNLGTALTAAGEDARYADLLFLLLGLPGLALRRRGRGPGRVPALRSAAAGDRPAPAARRVGRSDRPARRGRGGCSPLLGALRRDPARRSWPSGWRCPRVGPLRPAGPSRRALAGCCWRWRPRPARVARLRPRRRPARRRGRRRPAHRAPRTPWPLRAGLDVILLAGAAVRLRADRTERLPGRARPRGHPADPGQLRRAGRARRWPGRGSRCSSGG